MQVWRTTVVALVALVADAVDSNSIWEPARLGDVRSPCPGLNLMANHHIINHDGKNLTVPDLTKAMMDTFNFDHKLADFFANFGLQNSPNPNGTSYTLDDLNKHSAIEHDASLSRDDYYVTGNNHAFSWNAWGSVLGFFKAQDNVTIKSAALARQYREDAERQRDVNFNFSGSLRHDSFSESAIYLSALGSPVDGTAPVSFVREFFGMYHRSLSTIANGGQKRSVCRPCMDG
jgi:Peroxidase, family 2